MNKEESLAFLENCLEKVKKASAQDIDFFRKMYKLDCISSAETSDFEFVFPTIGLQCKYEINDEFDLNACELINNKSSKIQFNYSFICTNLFNQQNEYANTYEQTQNEALDKQLAYQETLINQQKESARKNIDSDT